MDTNDSPAYTTKTGARWYVSLFGGTKRRGHWRVPTDMRVIGTIGGANLDFSEAELPEPLVPLVLTKVSLVGGVSLRIPADVEVEVEGFRLFGGVRIEPAERTGPARVTLKVREYSIAGGVHVQRF
jgi:predicted membrane protein